MKYDNDVNKPIHNIQRALRRISYKYENVPKIVTDGVYGPQTTAAVKAFQKEFDLPQTGEVNNEVWDKIMEIYELVLEEYAEGKSLEVFPSPAFTLNVGDTNEIVPVVLAVISGATKRFSNFLPMEITDVYTQNDSENVKIFQGLSGLPQTGILNKTTWDMFAALFESEISKSRINPFDTDSDKIIKRDRVTYAPYSNDDYRL